MNREEAKYILRSYPVSGRDANDSQFSDALEMLKHDPELRAWFAQEQLTDKKISHAFKAFPVPTDLKGQLLAARRVIPERAWWQRPTPIRALAACLALVGTFAILLSRSPDKRHFEQFSSYVSDTTEALDHLDVKTSDIARIRSWLGEHNAPNDFSVRGKLNERSSVGCRVFEWDGLKVSLICFELENKKVAHLFVIDRSVLKGFPEGADPEFRVANQSIATASWSDAGCIYILAMQHGEQDLKSLFL